ncbi:MAG: bile acid:sodium symporter family protein [Pseudomonadota bacterium]
MDILVSVVLPLGLAFIMFSLGIGLTLADFRRVVSHGWAFVIGLGCQMLLVPLVAFAVVLAFDLQGEIAVGVMLLSFCPGGVTSNLISKLAKGDVALSVSLTAVVSLVSIATVPLLVAWAVVFFMGSEAPRISVTTLSIAMFLITTLPVGVGVLIRHVSPATANRIEPRAMVLSSALFVIIVVAAIAANWDLFVVNLASLGPALIVLNAALMLLGLNIAGVAKRPWQERKTISVETGVQNSTVAITLAPLITGVVTEIPAMGLPAAVYGVTMYAVALPFVLWMRSK